MKQRHNSRTINRDINREAICSSCPGGVWVAIHVVMYLQNTTWGEVPSQLLDFAAEQAQVVLMQLMVVPKAPSLTVVALRLLPLQQLRSSTGLVGPVFLSPSSQPVAALPHGEWSR